MWELTLPKCLVLLVAGLALPALAQQYAPPFAQCGGNGYKAGCLSGYRCQYMYPSYSQCVPDYYVDNPTHTQSSPIQPTPSVTPPSDAVVGCSGCLCQPRRKIQTLQSSYPEVFNMLLLAVEALQHDPEKQDTSWFGIGGIHGSPKVPWQMDPNVGPAGPYNTHLGYCTHGSALFCFWHRPYVLLIEQTICRKAKQIAQQFTGPSYEIYSAAADGLRMPYWDWADPKTQSHLPDVMMSATISVTRPGTGGVPVSQTIRNPLSRYPFQDELTLKKYFTGNFANWMWTLRAPTSADPGATSQNSKASAALQNGYQSRRSSTYSALMLPVFNEFSRRLEGIHNEVHVLSGGQSPAGHMATIDFAAFDPLFWLHHCNVDRLAAMYQAAHPYVYLTPVPGVPTFARLVPSTVDGPLDNLQTQLYPFKHPNGLFWRSDDIKTAGSIWKYNYGYEEVPCSYATQSELALQAFTKRRIKALYGPVVSRWPFVREPTRGMYSRLEFFLRVLVDHSEIPGSWTLHVFLDEPNVKPIDYATSPNRIGAISSFGSPQTRKPSMVYDNEISLSDVLYANKSEHDRDTIEKYLYSLAFRLTTDSKSADEVVEIPIRSLQTMRIAVCTANGIYTDPEKEPELSPVFPVLRDKKWLVDVTKGIPGGIKSEEELLSLKMLNGMTVDVPPYKHFA